MDAEYLPIIRVVAPMLGVLAVVYLLIAFVRRRRLATLTETLRAEASARGWTVSSGFRGELRWIQWHGSSNGVQWTAESRSGWEGSDADRRRVGTTRWQTAHWRGRAGPIVLMGKAGHGELPAAWPSGEGTISGLVRSALLGAINKYIAGRFTEEIASGIDATRLQRVEDAERRLPGYIVLAEQPADAARAIEQGIVQAVTAKRGSIEAADEAEAFFVIVSQQGIGLVRPGAAASLGELDPVIRTGIAIANVVKW